MAENLMAVLQAIDRLYGEVLDDAHWTRALRAVQEALGSACMCVAIRDDHTGHTVQHTSRGVASTAGDRLVPACSVEPSLKVDSRNGYQTLSAPNQAEPVPHNPADIVREYHWHCDPGCCSFCLGAPLVIADDVSGVAAAHWQQPGSGKQLENRRILQIMLPHIARSLLIEHRQNSMRNQATGSAFLMDRVTQAIMIVDGEGQLIRTNHKAQQILSRRDGLAVVDGKLETARADETDELQSLVTAAIKIGHPKGNARVSVFRPSGARSYAVMIEPLLAPDALPARGQGAAVIIISDFQSSKLLPWHALADLFKLTRSEARLAARLGAGDSLKEAAGELKISYRTAALHLEHLMHKTDTHRQSDLLRLLLLSPAMLAEQAVAPATHDSKAGSKAGSGLTF